MALVIATTAARAADPLSEALQQGLLAEEVRQDLDAAIASYQSVVDQHDAQRRWVATALFRLGESYRKQGKTAEAIATYRRLVAEFSDQTELARFSRQNLEALAPGAAVAAGPLPPAVQRQKELLAQELALVEQQIAEKRNQISVGRAPSGDLLPLQREALSLQRQMAALDATRRDLLSEVLLPSVAPADAILPIDGVTEEEQRELDRLIELVRNSPDLINFSTRGDPSLHAAARKGQLAVARFLIENGADLGLRDSGSYTPLHRAVEGGHKAMAEMLLAAGAEADAAGYSDKRPLHLAAFWGFTEIAKVLLAAGADVNAAARGGTPLHEAIPRERMPMIDLLLDSGADLEAKTPAQYEPAPGYTPLMLAVGSDLTLMVEHLLTRGAKVNATNAAGDHVLHVAVQSRRSDVILRALLERGPDLEARGSQNLTPLQVACVDLKRNNSTVRLLLEAGANPNVRFERAGSEGLTDNWRPVGGRSGRIALEADGRTPLHWAVADSDLELTRLLVAHGADPNARDHRGNTPLLGAVWERGERAEEFETELEVAFLDFLRQAAALLLSAGADPNLADETGRTLLHNVMRIGGRNPTFLHHAVRLRAVEVIERLLAAKADPNAVDSSGVTPMHGAALWPAPDAMERLLDHGGKVDPQDPLGHTPLHVAARAGKKEVVRFLLNRGAAVNARNQSGETPLDIATGTTPYAVVPGRGLVEAFDRRGTQVRSVAAPPSDEISDVLREHGAEAATPQPNPAPDGPAAERDIPSATDPTNP